MLANAVTKVDLAEDALFRLASLNCTVFAHELVIDIVISRTIHKLGDMANVLE